MNKKFLTGSIIIFVFIIAFVSFIFINKAVKTQNISANAKCRIKSVHYKGCNPHRLKFEYLNNGNIIKYYIPKRVKLKLLHLISCWYAGNTDAYKSIYEEDRKRLMEHFYKEPYKTVYDKDNKPLYKYFYCDKNSWECKLSDKYIYNAQGNIDTIYRDCDGNASNCKKMDKYEYDIRGNKTVHYENCDINFKNCKLDFKYIYNDKNQKIAEYNPQQKDYTKYVYDSHNNLIAEYEHCNANLQNCIFNAVLGVKKYVYDDKDNLIVYGLGCDRNSQNCIYGEKYIYNQQGKKIKLIRCGDNFKNCGSFDTYTYDEKDNMVTENRHCDSDTQECAENYKYEYDANNQKKAVYSASYSDKIFILIEKIERDKYNNITMQYSSSGRIKTKYICD